MTDNDKSSKIICVIFHTTTIIKFLSTQNKIQPTVPLLIINL